MNFACNGHMGDKEEEEEEERRRLPSMEGVTDWWSCWWRMTWLEVEKPSTNVGCWRRG